MPTYFFSLLSGLRLLRCGRHGFTGEFFAEKCSSEDRNPQSDTNRNRNEQGRSHVRTTEPPDLLEPFEDIAHEPAEIVGDHNNRQAFDCVLENGLALRRLVNTGQERQILRLEHEIDAGANDGDDSFKTAAEGVDSLQKLLIA